MKLSRIIVALSLFALLIFALVAASTLIYQGAHSLSTKTSYPIPQVPQAQEAAAKDPCGVVETNTQGGRISYCIMGQEVCVHQTNWGVCFPLSMAQPPLPVKAVKK